MKNIEKAKEEIKRFRECCQEKGAILLSVCRGKYSEGENFKGDLCRAVIIVGVPNLSLASPDIRMKFLYFKQRKDLMRTSI